jgi:hypothetical protein
MVLNAEQLDQLRALSGKKVLETLYCRKKYWIILPVKRKSY